MARARRRRIGPGRNSALLLVTFSLCGWALFYPMPYALCIASIGCGALAALALPRLTGGYYRLEEKGGRLGAAGEATLILSTILALRALIDIDMIDWKGPLLLAVTCGLAFAGLGVAADPAAFRSWTRKRLSGIGLSFFLAGVPFGWGATVEANMLLDRSAPTTHPLRVMEKWVVRGRTVRPHLRLAAPNDLGVGEVHVSDGLYARIGVGDFVCVQRGGGAFGFRWYSVETCPTAAAS